MMLQSDSVGEKRTDEFKSRRLREASKYIGRSWLPASPIVLKRLHEKLNSEGPIDLQDIYLEMTSDFGLFAHCLRKIGGAVGLEGSIENPAAILRALPVEELREIFGSVGTELGIHDFNSIKDVQLTRVKHSIISLSAVDMLSHSAGIDGDLAGICAMVRQLGHLFVAWNYPSSCVRAKSNMEASGKLFEEELEKLLGFTPIKLGIEAAMSWCKNPDFLCGAGISPLEGSGAGKDGAKLLEVCHAGEVLARINDPENYPSASKEWKAADETLRRYLGPKGTAMIRERMEETYPHYVTLAPNLFPKDLSPERAAKTVNHAHSKKLLEANLYVKRCPEKLRFKFEEVYGKVLPGEASFDAVNVLVSQVIPTAGFLSGCVYLLDPKKMILVPRLMVGDAKGRTFKAVSCSCGGLKSHPVSEAFHCTTPLKEENVILNGDIVSHVTGKFGNGDRIGILYLEFKDAIPHTDLSETRLLFFKAIRQALTDCLALK